MEKENLLKELDKEMHNIYKGALSEAGYKATRFLQMLHEKGGLETARYLLRSKLPSEGYTILCAGGHFDLTVEAMILNNEKFHSLFSVDDLNIAKKRLRPYRE